MSKRYLQHLNRQSKVKVMALAHNPNEINLVWFVTFAAALVAVAFYFFSLFFGFTGWRALTER